MAMTYINRFRNLSREACAILRDWEGLALFRETDLNLEAGTLAFPDLVWAGEP
jgi:hypothetical protein